MSSVAGDRQQRQHLRTIDAVRTASQRRPTPAAVTAREARQVKRAQSLRVTLSRRRELIASGDGDPFAGDRKSPDVDANNANPNMIKALGVVDPEKKRLNERRFAEKGAHTYYARYLSRTSRSLVRKFLTVTLISQ